MLKLNKSNGFVLSDCSKKMLILFAVLLAAGCSHDPAQVRIQDLRSPPRVTSGQHTVRHGETLYSIAWLYNRDFRELARSNGIHSPYTIFPSQRINLAVSRSAVVSHKAPNTRQSLPAKAATKSKLVKKHTSPAKSKSPATYSVRGWNWPARGRIVSRFSLKPPANKGIDIGGKLGESVKAAANGEVVYAGSDLSGYGRLIILKHNSSYLSAYAHNKEMFVREGDSVKAGQKIAEIGSTGTTEPKLHFEIRRNGKPVDPMGYLPKR